MAVLVVFDPPTRRVKRVVIAGRGEKLHPSHGPHAGEQAITLPLTNAFADPFNRAAMAAHLANYGLKMP